jgi:hypothetical protein
MLTECMMQPGCKATSNTHITHRDTATDSPTDQVDQGYFSTSRREKKILAGHVSSVVSIQFIVSSEPAKEARDILFLPCIYASSCHYRGPVQFDIR